MYTSQPFTIGFIGLGLIGGSIAKSIRRIFPDYRILAYDVDAAALEEAIADGTVHIALSEINEQIADCNYIFLCAPVHYNIEYLPLLKKYMKPDCILTDVGSVKTDIYQAVLDQQLSDVFIGGHPMVGSERSGYSAAHDHLIENAYYFITPSSTVSRERSMNSVPLLKIWVPLQSFILRPGMIRQLHTSAISRILLPPS